MMEVHELLRMKENELAQVRKELEALRLVAPMLSEADQSESSDDDSDDAVVSLDDADGTERVASSTDSDDLVFKSFGPKRSRLRDWLGRAAGE
jgi:hypothetical protein